MAVNRYTCYVTFAPTMDFSLDVSSTVMLPCNIMSRCTVIRIDLLSFVLAVTIMLNVIVLVKTILCGILRNTILKYSATKTRPQFGMCLFVTEEENASGPGEAQCMLVRLFIQ